MDSEVDPGSVGRGKEGQPSNFGRVDRTGKIPGSESELN